MNHTDGRPAPASSMEVRRGALDFELDAHPLAAAAADRPAAAAGPHPTRSRMLVPAYQRLCARLGIRPDAAGKLESETPQMQAPHAQLRHALQSDPSMAALLPAAPGRLVLGCADGPFFLRRSGLLHLPPTLLDRPAALALAARWGLEASHLQTRGLLHPSRLAGIVRHGRSLLRAASAASCDALLEGLPGPIAEELMDSAADVPSAALLAWQRSRIEGLAEAATLPGAADALDAEPEARASSGAEAGSTAAGANAVELWNCVEELLVSGGDSRLAIDPRTGFNRYGTVPRPRPEAVHFSSSTASSVSDYGFLYCDLLRRDLLAAMLREDLDAAPLRARSVDAIGRELLDLLTLHEHEADVVLAPSGTDTEMLAALLGVAAGRALTNILIAPEETGRGVREAGAGKYFDTLSAASGQAVPRGQCAWPQAAIRIVEIPVRDAAGVPQATAAVVAQLRQQIEQALARSERVLLHFLATSKTGLSTPGEAAVDELARIAPESIDVVVDACQMRSPFAQMGAWVRRGWMVQVSGSKFLTGPPFSGALLLPPLLRRRAAQVRKLLEQAPAVGSAQDWNGWWREQLARAPGGRTADERTPGDRTAEERAPGDQAPQEIRAGAGAQAAARFGTIFRWLPALLEAQLFNAIPRAVQEYSFHRFRTALNERLGRSAWLARIDELRDEPLDEPDDGSNDERSDKYRPRAAPDLATRSILCFAVRVAHWDGSRRALNEAECRKIFQLLNLDLRDELGQLSPAERAQAGLQAHIGQPLVLAAGAGAPGKAMLRMVLGARFFSIVAHAGPGSVEAALESEIADAIRALEKLELLARMWSKAQRIAV